MQRHPPLTRPPGNGSVATLVCYSTDGIRSPRGPYRIENRPAAPAGRPRGAGSTFRRRARAARTGRDGSDAAAVVAGVLVGGWLVEGALLVGAEVVGAEVVGAAVEGGAVVGSAVVGGPRWSWLADPPPGIAPVVVGCATADRPRSWPADRAAGQRHDDQHQARGRVLLKGPASDEQ